jgi:hypothetical protein
MSRLRWDDLPSSGELRGNVAVNHQQVPDPEPSDPAVVDPGALTRVEAEAVRDELIVTYRFLRLGIVAAVAVLGLALLFEWQDADCLKGSISAYFYSPVRSVFVGSLMAIGLCLIAIRGRSNWEEFWLNLAGILAPIVALVPTRPSADCPSRVTTTPGSLALDKSDPLPDWVVWGISNNVLAYFLICLGALVGLGFWVLHMRGRLHQDPKKAQQLLVALSIYALLIVSASVLHWRVEGFKTHSHWAAAIAMFVCIFWVVVINWRRRPNPPYKSLYLGIWISMPATAAFIGAYKLLEERTDLVPEWGEDVYWLEVSQITLFAVFWITQTVQRWNYEPVPLTSTTSSS